MGRFVHGRPEEGVHSPKLELPVVLKRLKSVLGTEPGPSEGMALASNH